MKFFLVLSLIMISSCATAPKKPKCKLVEIVPFACGVLGYDSKPNKKGYYGRVKTDCYVRIEKQCK